MRAIKWHAGRMIYALARHFNWFQNRMMTEFYIDGGQADLVFISRAGYLTEIEIKVSVSDWNADQKKMKFQKPRPHVARFFYAIPETLSEKIPDWLPEHAGLLVVGADGYVHELRAARRMRAKKVPDAQIASLMRSCYFRFWRKEMSTLRQRLTDEGLNTGGAQWLPEGRLV